jgi:N-acetylmuramoyl-L-alanine amidase
VDPNRPLVWHRGRVAVVAALVLAIIAAATYLAFFNSSAPDRDATGRASGPSVTGTSTTTTLNPEPLAGKVVGIDPGHNGRNYTEPDVINQDIWNGREEEACDTTGTETAGGYTEAQFNFNGATYLATDLMDEGAKVVMTRANNSGVGPCVTQRAAIINDAHADVAIDIHADGGPETGRGFAILEPVADGPNDGIIGSSVTFGNDLKSAFLATGMPISTYDGTNGFDFRDDLAGLNLATEPKVLIECGNMANAVDASMLITPQFQEAAAKAMAAAITTFLRDVPSGSVGSTGDD